MEQAGIEDLLGRLQLDAHQKAPLYVQLSQFLRDCILSGSLKPGTRLPTEKDLQRMFRVSRITVRQALDSLVREGRIRRRRGLGTEILAPRQEVILDRRVGLEQALRALGRPVYRHRVAHEVVPSNDVVAAFLGVTKGQAVLQQASILFVDGDRVACSERFQLRHATVTEPQPGSPGGPPPDPRHQTVEMVPACHPVTDHLQVSEGTPVLRHVLGLFQSGRPVEWQEHHYRSDCYRYRFRV